MKERVDRICNSFKTGVFTWILAYVLLYVISHFVGDFTVYNDNVMKLLNIGNFIAQVVIAGTTYATLEIILLHFVDDMLKAFEDRKNYKKVAKSLLISGTIVAILCVALYILKEMNIISKYVLKLMMTIIVLKAVIFSVAQVGNTKKYNQKLQEINK